MEQHHADFEWVDYSLASAWERWLLDWESAIRRLLLAKEDSKNEVTLNWTEDESTQEWSLSYFKLEPTADQGSASVHDQGDEAFFHQGNLGFESGNVPARNLPWNRWTGSRDFFYCYPKSSHIHQAQWKWKIQSAFAIAVQNLIVSPPADSPLLGQCIPPLFFLTTQSDTSHEWRQLMAGCQYHALGEYHWQSHHLPLVPRSLDCLQGLVEYFYGLYARTEDNNGSSTESISVAVRYQYSIDWKDELESRLSFPCSVSQLVLGPIEDPMDSFHCTMMLMNYSLEDLVDNPVYSNIHTKFIEGDSQSVWSMECLVDPYPGNTMAVVGCLLANCMERTVSGWLEALPNDLLESYRDNKHEHREYVAGIAFVDQPDCILAVRRLFQQQAPLPFVKVLDEQGTALSDLWNKWMPHGTKVPLHSLLYEFNRHLMRILQGNGQPSRQHFIPSLFAYLTVAWPEFCRQLRKCWEKKAWIPGIPILLNGLENQHGEIDLKLSIVYQKLVLLQLCIHRYRKQRGIAVDEPVKDAKNILDDLMVEQGSSQPGLSVVKNTVLKGIKSSQKAGDTLVQFFDQITANEDSRKTVAPKAHPPSSSRPRTASISKMSTHTATDPDDWTWTEEESHHQQQSIGFETDDDEVFYDTFEQLEERSVPVALPMNPSTRIAPSSLSSIGSSYDHVTHQMAKESAEGSSRTEVYNESLRMTSDSPVPPIKELTDPSEHQGRLKPLSPPIRSLSSGELIYIPETQEPPLLTEDGLRDLERVYEELGTTVEAQKIRAKMQSAQLISDMEAFKAANPGCVLEDFVRWHSPRDWIADGTSPNGIGGLSARMTEPGNLWHELWSNTKRIPAAWQKPLFNVEKEFEKTLHWLEQLPIHALILYLMPTIFSIAYLETHQFSQKFHEFESCRVQLDSLTTYLNQMRWSTVYEELFNHLSENPDIIETMNVSRHLKKCDDFIEHLRAFESALACLYSLTGKLPRNKCERFIDTLVARTLSIDIDMHQESVKPFLISPESSTCLVPTLELRNQLLRHIVGGDALGGGGLSSTSESTTRWPSPSIREFLLLRKYSQPSRDEDMEAIWNAYFEGNEELLQCALRTRLMPSDRMYAQLKDGDFRIVERRYVDTVTISPTASR